MNRILIIIFLFLSTVANAQIQQSARRDGTMSPTNSGDIARGGQTSRDTTGNKQVPKGITVWTVNKITGDRTPALPDTTSYLRMNYNLPSGIYGDYTTLGNNGSTRLNRIFIDREQGDDFIFTNGYSQTIVRPEDFHFTNTYSPITNLDYSECGDKLNGEDHLKAMFAVNANKQLGFGFKFDYLYARGYYANQNTAHFDYTMWGSYLGERYQAHLLMSTNHQKQAENGGLANDDYIKHPEQFPESYAENEIPTILSKNWNRNDNQHIFFTHRYSFGFSRSVPMNEQERAAKKFAQESAKEAKDRNAKNTQDKNDSRNKDKAVSKPKGRPDGAKIMGNEPGKQAEGADSTRIAMTTEEAKNLSKAKKGDNPDDEFMKEEYVPVTSIFHTLNLDNYRRTYLAYSSPVDFYKNDFYDLKHDSISDKSRLFYMRNTLGISMLEGFNKWMKAGFKIFGAHELKQFSLPEIDGTFSKITHSNVLVGGGISKQEGKTLHFNAIGELCAVGTDFGQISIDGDIDLNIPVLGDTVRLDAKGFFHLYNPSTFFTQYKSRHFQWDMSDEFSKTTHTHVEGNLSFKRTETRLRVAVDNLTNYTYFGTTYGVDSTTTNYTHKNLDITPRQASDIQVVTAQLYQNLHFGIVHWDNVLTFQKSTDEIALPLPKLNIYSNLYLRFKIAHVLATDFGVDARFFTKYNAPEYSPQLQSYVIQENEAIRTQVGKYPICNVYANFQLKTCRFYIMMSHVNCMGKGDYFLTPHYPVNGRILRFGLNWNFFN